MVNIIYLMINILRTYIILDFIDTFLHQKRKWPRYSGGFSFVFYYLATSYIYFNMSGVLNNLGINLILCAAVVLCYHASIFKKTLAVAFINIIPPACEYITAASIGLMYDTSIIKVISKGDLILIGLIISNLLMVCLIRLLQAFIRRHNTYNSNLRPSYWLALLFVPAGSLYIIFSLSLVSQQTSSLSFLQSSVIIILVINIIIFYLYDRLLKEEKVKYENILLLRQNDAYEKQAVLTEKFQKSIRERNHDINNHLAAILGLAQQNRPDDLALYIKKLIHTETPESGISSGNLVIDAIVNSKLYIASQQNTEMDINISLEASLEINKFDITIILGNLLDNALEACMKLPEEQREVHLDIYFQHGVFHIVIENTYDMTDLFCQDGTLYSTKKEKKWHGIGLKNVECAVKKYNGIFEHELTSIKEKQIFIAKVMLYLNSSGDGSKTGL